MNTKSFKALEKEIKKIIAGSTLPEDYAHALKTKELVLKLNPWADWSLQIAALAHDIERAFPHKKVKRQDYPNYDEFKKAHAANSAQIMREILARYDFDSDIKKRIIRLIEHHEFGLDNDPELAVLKEADSLSFFEVNLPFYAQRSNDSEILFRMKWGYQRLSPSGRLKVKKLSFQNEKLNKLLEEVILLKKAKSK